MTPGREGWYEMPVSLHLPLDSDRCE
jgi:hypothetical protein